MKVEWQTHKTRIAKKLQALSRVRRIIGKLGGGDELRVAANQLRSLLYAA